MDKHTMTTEKTTWRGLRITPAAAGEALVWSLISLLLGQARLPFDAYPLGLGLICAARSRVGWIALGLAASAFAAAVGSPWPRLAAAALALVVRVSVRVLLDPPPAWVSLAPADRLRALAAPAGRHLLWDESLTLRMATAAAAAFLSGVWVMVAGGLRYDDLAAAILALVAAPLFCLGLSPFFDDGARQASTLAWEGSAGILLTALCYAVRETDLFGVSLAAFLSFVLSLCVTRARGAGRGAILGAATGLCVGPLYAPLFGLGAGVAGLLWPKSATAAITLAALLGMAWGGYVDGLMALVKLVPALVCGAIFVLSADRFGLLPGETAALPRLAAPARDAPPSLDRERAESAQARLSALSDSFAALSQLCVGLSDRMRRPTMTALRQVCDDACDRYCRDCRERGRCWESEYGATLDAWGKLTVALHGAGRAEADAVPAYLRDRCPSLDDILGEINLGCARLWAEGEAAGERFAIDYEAVSDILAETLASEQADYTVDEAMTARVRACAAEMGLGARGILCWGERRKQILCEGLDLRRAGVGGEAVQAAFSACCGIPLTAPSLCVEDDLVSMRLTQARRLAVESVKCVASAEDDTACGDSVLTLESVASDRFYALISDGMGSGREAAMTARICTAFLEKMLAAGNRRETALRLLNAFVRARGIECSATIDLAEFDLITGRAAFLKSGAAPSYVRRDGNLFKLQSKTVPIGIMRALDAEQLCFDLEPGDVIVMLSDGIAQSFEESVWLLDLLSAGWDDTEELATVAERILAAAATHNARPDDRSIILARIKEA